MPSPLLGRKFPAVFLENKYNRAGSAELDFVTPSVGLPGGMSVLEVWRDMQAKCEKDIVSGRDEPSRARQGQRSELPGSSKQ